MSMTEDRIIEDQGLHLNLDGQGKLDADTGIPFLNHLLEAFCRHGLFDMALPPLENRPEADPEVLFAVGEQVGTAFAKARRQYLGDLCSGHFILPMDDSLVQVTVDLQSKRSYMIYNATVKHPRGRSFDFRDIEEFFNGFLQGLYCNLHIELEYGDDPHHAAESIFKCVARALDAATAVPYRLRPMSFWDKIKNLFESQPTYIRPDET